jgi:hypothetical protein
MHLVPTRKSVAISGPFRAASVGLVLLNIGRAEQLGHEVRKLGARPYIPHSVGRAYTVGELPDVFGDDRWLADTLEDALACDAMVMLPDWKLSEGAVNERKQMLALGKPVFEGPAALDELRSWLATQTAMRVAS